MRSSWLLLGLGVLACRSGKIDPVLRPLPNVDQPAPQAKSDTGKGTKSDTATTEIALEEIDSAAVVDSADSKEVVDSAKDEKALEELHDASPNGDESVDEDAEADALLNATFDINVTRYAENPRVKYYLKFFQTKGRDRMTVWLSRMPVYAPMIREAMIANDLPLDIGYLALIESGYSNVAVSRSRATGMWQFMKGTGLMYGLKVNKWVDERRDPIRATDAAARHLADLRRRFNGSSYLAAAAYNAGAGKVSRGLRRLGSWDEDDFVPAETDVDPEAVPGDERFFQLTKTRYLRLETKDYVPKLIAAAMIAKQPEKYGFPPIPEVEPYAVDSVKVSQPTALEAIAKVAGLPAAKIFDLNPHYIRRVTPPSGTWWVRVPVGYGEQTQLALADLPEAERMPTVIRTVRRGESLRSIARSYGLTVDDLLSYNPKVSPKKGLRAGQKLRVPGSARIRAVASEGRPVSGGSVHVVRRGETLTSIAARYGVSIRQLRDWNGLNGARHIWVGQRLRVRAATTKALKSSSKAKTASYRSSQAKTVHVVRSGDNLTELAKRYGCTIAEIKQANGLAGGKIRIGEKLKIPS